MPYDEQLGCIRETRKFYVTLKVAAWDSKNFKGPQPGIRGCCFEQRKIDGEWMYYVKFTGHQGTYIAYSHQVT